MRRTGSPGSCSGPRRRSGLLAPALRAAGARRIVGLTHGHETWWAGVPGARSLLRRIGETGATTSPSSRRSPSGGSPPRSARPRGRGCCGSRLWWTPTCSDPASPARRPRRRRGPSRSAGSSPQKGFDTLLRAWRRVVDRMPDSAEAPRAGPGRRRARSGHACERLIARLGLAGAVRLTGALPRTGVVAELQRARRLRAADADPAGRAEPRGPRSGGRSRLPPAACRSWSVAPAARPRRCRPGRPASSSTRTTMRRWPTGWSTLLTDPDRSPAMGAAAGGSCSTVRRRPARRRPSARRGS